MKPRLSIKKKLIISNILIIIVPLGIALALFGVFVNGTGARYWESMEIIYNDDNGIYSVQSLMHTDIRDAQSDEAVTEMRNAGYHYEVKKDDSIVFSNLTADDIEQAKEAIGNTYGKNGEYSITSGGVSVVHMSFEDDDEDYNATAIHTPDIPKKHGDSYMKRYIALYIGFMIIVLIGSVVLMNFILTWWISRSILKPLKELRTASGLIRDGELDFEMKSTRRDEMGDMINDFDEMRLHLKASVDERLKYEEYRKELVTGISHDLRTPLTSIKGYVEGLKDGIANTAEMKAKYYAAIETSVGTLEKLVSDLTDMSRLEAGGYAYDLKAEDLNVFYREEIETLRNEYVQADVDIRLDESAEPLIVAIDRKEISRIDHNVLSNALKYRTADHTVFTVSLDRDGDIAVIALSDNGPGVADEELDHIFTCFYRSDSSRTRSSEGSGIGLAVVRQIADAHHGTVHAENNNGLSIVIKLPLSKGDAE